jgi:hypothetical protein
MIREWTRMDANKKEFIRAYSRVFADRLNG